MWRIRDRDTFVELRRSGRRVRRPPLAVSFVAGAPGEPPRVAYAVGRPVGGAVVRNRVRRRLRAVVAAAGVAGRLGPGAYLIGAQPGAAEATFAELAASFDAALDGLTPTAVPATAGGSR